MALPADVLGDEREELKPEDVGTVICSSDPSPYTAIATIKRAAQTARQHPPPWRRRGQHPLFPSIHLEVFRHGALLVGCPFQPVNSLRCDRSSVCRNAAALGARFQRPVTQGDREPSPRSRSSRSRRLTKRFHCPSTIPGYIYGLADSGSEQDTSCPQSNLGIFRVEPKSALHPPLISPPFAYPRSAKYCFPAHQSPFSPAMMQ